MSNISLELKEKFTKALDVFSAKFHKEFLGQHRVASPFGAWCLLAFVSANDENPHPSVDKNLGCSTKEAKEILSYLLTEKPEIVSLAVKSWINPQYSTLESYQQWNRDVSDFNAVEFELPAKEKVSEWVNKESLGLIKEFPLQIDPNFIALFATIVATDITWAKPFKVVENPLLTEKWGIAHVLFDDEAEVFIHDDPDYGYFGVHVAQESEKEVKVYSVIPLSENVSEANTMAVARQVAQNLHPERVVALQDLPLDNTYGGILKVVEYEGSEDTTTAVLPAWKTQNSYDLKNADLGLMESANRFSDSGPAGVDIIQVAVAEYNAKGFKAAALTAMLMRATAMFSQWTVRHLELTYTKPYAVVAVADSSQKSIWSNTPIFEGWISEAVEAAHPDNS